MKTNIFLSYCWSDTNEADKIYDYFKSNQDIELHRDIINIGKWRSIKEYMQSISNMDYTILLISDSYLKSVNCMYEVLEVMRDRNYRDKIFPAVVYSEIYNPITKAKYVKYWQDEFWELESKLKEINLQNLGKLNGDLKQRQDISSNIAEFLDVVSDMNNPNIEDVCVIIKEKLNQKGFIGNKQTKSENDLFITLGRTKAEYNSEPTELEINPFVRDSFNQINYEDDVYKKSTGIKKGLRLCGNEDEIKVAEQLSEFFKITFSKAGMFKTTSYVFNFLQPGKEFRDYYNLYNEVLLLFSPYTEFESRTLDFVDKTLEEFDNRLDKVCVFLISKDPNIESKINGINTSNKDSRIIVPFTYNEILHNGISKDDISAKLRRYFYNRDLFALESPLKTEAYFYGRNTLIQKLYDKYLMGEQSGLFGLRKTGKTSVLYALERQMILRSGYSIYIDCQNPGIYMLRWNELLKYIIEEIIKKYELDLTIDEDLYIEKKAADSFEKNLKKINNKIRTRVLLMFDEIEHICFKTSDKEHWRSGEDYCMFWQTVRSVFQKEPECFTFLIAGVNPLCIEKDYVNGIENPIFSMISSEYLSLFDLSNVRDMIGHIGKYMGLSFEEEIYTRLTEDYGGHPFLIRHICSLINTNVNANRPCSVSKYEYDAKKKEYDTKIVHYVEMILGVLKIWYPSEYELLEILAIDGNDELKKNLEYKEKEMQHLLGYGIVKEYKGNYYITINAVRLYLENNHKLQGKQTTKQQAWSNISMRRNTLEDRLRKIMLVQMTMQYGSKKVKGKLLEVVESSRRERERLHDLEVNDLIENHFYLLDIKHVILKNWSIFEKLFIDKVKFENFIDTINKFRIDAHAKTIDDSDMLMLMLAFNWFDERLEGIPV